MKGFDLGAGKKLSLIHCNFYYYFFLSDNAIVFTLPSGPSGEGFGLESLLSLRPKIQHFMSTNNSLGLHPW